MFGKLLGIIITLPLLLIYWPVDSISLLNQLNKDQILSTKLVGIAETNLASFQKAHDELQKCQKEDKNSGAQQLCVEKNNQALKNISDQIVNQTPVSELFGNEAKKTIDCKIPLPESLLQESPLQDLLQDIKNCKRAELTPGIFVTWILVALGSAFWLGVLNKMLGIRSEFSKKLDAQREFRTTNQN